jgi:hypothetical protein
MQKNLTTHVANATYTIAVLRTPYLIKRGADAAVALQNQ